jgi:hypothetical protein
MIISWARAAAASAVVAAMDPRLDPPPMRLEFSHARNLDEVATVAAAQQ